MCVHVCVYMHACAYMYCCNLCVEVKERTVGVSSLLPAYLGPRSHWVPRLIVKVFITRAISLALSYGFLIANLHNYVNQFYSPPTHTHLFSKGPLHSANGETVQRKMCLFRDFVWRQLLVSCIASTKSVSLSFRFF